MKVNNNMIIRSVLHQGLLFGLRKFLPESLREEYSEDPGTGGHHPHDEDRSWQPVDLQQVQEETGDAAYPGHQGAGADRLVPDDGGEHLRRVDVDDSEAGAGSELSNQRQEDLESLEAWVVRALEEAADDARHTGHGLEIIALIGVGSFYYFYS